MATSRQLVETLGRRPELVNSRVLDAIAAVPRDEFVPAKWKGHAWVDQAIPLGGGSSVSQPLIVAMMTQAVDPGPGRKILEVGTGSGYQAAILRWLGCEVWTVEVDAELAEAARLRLARLGFDRIRGKVGDGRLGWPEPAPYDGIIVTASGKGVPPALVEQLIVGGKITLPLQGYFGQKLKVLVKCEDGSFEAESQIPVRFVPLRDAPVGAAPSAVED